MKIKSFRGNYGVLAFGRKSDEKAIVHHFNNDDGHYCYRYDLTGTKEELDVIEEFCAKLSGHYGKKNPYASMSCSHKYIEVDAETHNRESNYSKYGKKSIVNPNIPDFKAYKCAHCDAYKYPDSSYKGFPVELFECDFDNRIVAIYVHPVKGTREPAPELAAQLKELGFEPTGNSSSGFPGEQPKIYYSTKY